jgi:hypothetical protein
MVSYLCVCLLIESQSVGGGTPEAVAAEGGRHNDGVLPVVRDDVADRPGHWQPPHALLLPHASQRLRYPEQGLSLEFLTTFSAAPVPRSSRVFTNLWCCRL